MLSIVCRNPEKHVTPFVKKLLCQDEDSKVFAVWIETESHTLPFIPVKYEVTNGGKHEVQNTSCQSVR